MSRVKGCLKIGCIGCGGIACFFLISAIVVGIGVAVSNEEPSLEQRELSRSVPGVDLPDGSHRPGFEADPSQATTDDIRQPLFRAADFGDVEGGIVDLRLSVGEFFVEPGPAGEPIRVEADFNANRYELKETYEPASGDDPWIYKVRFGPKGFFKWFGIDEGRPPKVKVIIPRDSPFFLTGKITMGESDVELGGLWLTGVDLTTGMGEHAVSFSEPVARPIESFEVDGSMGALSIRDLGNASPRSTDVHLSMGELKVDLEGPWAQDAEVGIRASMGECTIRLPDRVNVDLRRASIGLGERTVRGIRDREPIPGAPTLRLSASHSMGELQIR